MVDSTLAFDLIARDRASSAFDKVARSADKTGAALAKTGKISDEVAKASAHLTKAHGAESDALDKVHLAEVRLAEVRSNEKSKTSQIIAAENALSSARRKAAAAGNVAQKAAKDLGNALDDEGKQAGKGFSSSLKKWFTGQGGSEFRDAGKAGGEQVSSGLMGVLKTPVLGPVLLGAVGGAVATVMPAVGAIAASGLVAGFGAGLAGLGIVFAAKSQVVQNVWKKTLTGMGADMQVISKPFEKTLVSMAGVAKRTFDGFHSDLDASFKLIAPAVTEFGDQMGLAFEKLAPAIRPLSLAFADVLKSLGPAFQSALGNVSKGLQDIAASVQKSPNGLADLVKGAGDLFKTLSDGIATLNDINGAFENFTGGISLVDVVMKGMQATIEALFGPFVFLLKAMNALGIKGADTGKAIAISADSTKLWTQGLTAAQAAAVKTGAALPGVSASAAALAAKFDRQWAATQKANDALTRMSGLLLTLSGSEIAYQQAVDDASASIKENGRTHDINTAKGRANKTALDQVAASANAQTVAMRNAGDGNVAAAKHGETARASFVKLATQMGYTVPQAKRMAKSMVDIPNVTREAKLKANKVDLDAKLAAAKKQLADPKLTKERKAKLNADISRLKAAVANAQATINGLHGKNVKIGIVTTYTSKGVITNTPSSAGRVAPGEKRAGGGPVRKGMPYWVGEEGPEPFIPDQNGTIIPNHKVKSSGRAFSGGGGGGVQRLELVIRGDDGSRYAQFLASELTRLLRGRGADMKILRQIGLA